MPGNSAFWGNNVLRVPPRGGSRVNEAYGLLLCLTVAIEPRVQGPAEPELPTVLALVGVDDRMHRPGLRLVYRGMTVPPDHPDHDGSHQRPYHAHANQRRAPGRFRFLGLLQFLEEFRPGIYDRSVSSVPSGLEPVRRP